MKLYKFQKDILKKMETEKHVHIETGLGKAHILIAYALKHPRSRVIISISPSLFTQYSLLAIQAGAKNIVFVT